MTKVAQVMTHDAVSIHATDTIRQAAQMMADLEVGSLPICEGEELIGTVTDRDIAVRAVASGVDPSTPVADIATQHVQWCYEDDDINEVKRKMAGRRIRRIPVLDHQKHLVGIVSLGDIATSDGAGAATTLKAVSRPTKSEH
ncbi:CBS domain-containing protein [Paraburkholderia tagetis]|uniref:CBS domain-containing protein n=1 Tax=Paraburkholderia tagetis TaxID=2913261 RepID=A0A9X1RPR6_9BURK|nr:CBS domain-containing protein [Paraburkholderia tagetis]MCG5072709.1 CBS domain-containing protein [Paraburkholderia tagetis]